MKPRKFEPSFCEIKQEELVLSAEALASLMKLVLARGSKFRFRARGSSMHPFIKNDDVLTITPVSLKELKTGDVIAFLRPGSGNPAVHRIVRLSDDVLITKGDNNRETDGSLPEESILGRIELVERRGKKLRLGLGFEKLIIAFLTGHGLWLPIFRVAGFFFGFFAKR